MEGPRTRLWALPAVAAILATISGWYWTHKETIEPADVVSVEVPAALPGRPISGERLVRPDGSITLGWYGRIAIAGLSTTEAKVRIVNSLRRHLSDESLGLTGADNNAARAGGVVVSIATKNTPGALKRFFQRFRRMVGL